MKKFVARFVRDEEGQDLIEYALLCSFVAVVASAGASLLGSKLNGWYSAIATSVSSMSSTLGSGS